MPGICARCEKQVYFAEERRALGKVYHKLCFKCGKCGKLCDSTNAADHDNDLYCKTCHGRLFGPVGIGFGIGAGILSSDKGNGLVNGSSTEDIPEPAEAHVVTKVSYGTVGTDGTNGTNGTNGATNGTHGITKTKTIKTTNGLENASRYGISDVCRRCDKRVYLAEKKMGAGFPYHLACFNCAQCNKRLDSMLCERETEIYCRASGVLNSCFAMSISIAHCRVCLRMSTKRLTHFIMYALKLPARSMSLSGIRQIPYKTHLKT